jgi:hypothetical protein
MKIDFLTKYGLFALLLASALHGASCFTTHSKAQIGEDELSGVVSLSLKDATTCKSIPYGEMVINGEKIVADEDGILKVPQSLYDGVSDAQIPITLQKTGYITLASNLEVMVGSVWNNFFLLTKELDPKSIRVVLEWSDKPKDLDLHLESNDFHIAYNNMKNYQNKAKLDIDSRNGYGPETITLDSIEKNKTYKFYLENYSKESRIEGIVKATIYSDNKHKKTIEISPTSSTKVDLFEIKNGKIQ